MKTLIEVEHPEVSRVILSSIGYAQNGRDYFGAATARVIHDSVNDKDQGKIDILMSAALSWYRDTGSFLAVDALQKLRADLVRTMPAPTSAGVPEGWKLVPYEPTREMRAEMDREYEYMRDTSGVVAPAQIWRVAYRAARPTSEATTTQPAADKMPDEVKRAIRSAKTAMNMWENGYAFDTHGKSRDIQREIEIADALLTNQQPAADGGGE